MATIQMKSAVGGAIDPSRLVSKRSVFQPRQVLNPGDQIVSIPSQRSINPKPMRFGITGANAYVNLGLSNWLATQQSHTLVSPTTMSYNYTLALWQEEIAEATYFLNGFDYQTSSSTNQFSQEFVRMTGSQGRYSSEDLTNEIAKAQSPAALNALLLPVRFEAGVVKNINKSTLTYFYGLSGQTINITYYFSGGDGIVVGSNDLQ